MSEPSDVPSAGEGQEHILRSCPCLYVEPCSYACTCANPTMSGGCDRCCSYGSFRQRLMSAVILSEMPYENTNLKAEIEELKRWEDRWSDRSKRLEGSLTAANKRIEAMERVVDATRGFGDLGNRFHGSVYREDWIKLNEALEALAVLRTEEKP